MPASRRRAIRQLIVASVGLGVIAIGAGIYSHFRIAPISPAPNYAEKLTTAYWPAFHTLPLEQKAHILDGEFLIEGDVNRLPDGLKFAFSRLAGESDFKMANPGEKYQETDVISFFCSLRPC